MWGFIGFIILIAIIFGITPHEAFWGVAGTLIAFTVVGWIVYIIYSVYEDTKQAKGNKNISQNNAIIDHNKEEVVMPKYGGVGAVEVQNIREGVLIGQLKKMKPKKKVGFWGNFFARLSFAIMIIATAAIIVAIILGVGAIVVQVVYWITSLVNGLH